MSKITITVSGHVGSGKSAICGEIEILCRALGLQVEWDGGQEEKKLTHADWTEALEMYKPTVEIVEHILPTAARAPRTEVAGSEPIAWVWCDTICPDHCHSTDAEAIEEGWIPLVYGDPKAVQVADEQRSKIEAAIKATEYKYFGSYEFTETQHDAVDVLVEAASTLLSAPLIAPQPPSADAAAAGQEAAEVIGIVHRPARNGADFSVEWLRSPPAGAKLYTAPPAQVATRQGLTDEQRKAIKWAARTTSNLATREALMALLEGAKHE